MMEKKLSAEGKVESEEMNIELNNIDSLMLEQIDRWLIKDSKLIKRIYLLIKNLKA